MVQTAARARAPKILIFLLFYAAACADLSSAPKAKEPPFCASPDTVRFDVFSERGSDKRTWIDLSAEVEAVFRCPVEPILETLWDFESSPGVFKRIESVNVRSDDGKVAVTEQKSAIRVLGLSFESSLVFENEMIRNGDGTAVFMFKTIEVDAITRSVTGSWYLEEFADAAGVATRVRYSMQSYVESAFLGQEWIMRSFGEGDIENVVRELATAVRARAGG